MDFISYDLCNQDNSESTEDQSRTAELPSGSGEDLSRRELRSTKDPLGSPDDPSTQGP
jgi:hypothetical protein